MSLLQVFAEAQVFFSVGGRHFNGQPITYSTLEDRIFESSRNVSIKLHHRVGRFVKLRLHFAAKWMLISEISFDSGEWHVRSDVHRKIGVMSEIYFFNCIRFFPRFSGDQWQLQRREPHHAARPAV